MPVPIPAVVEGFPFYDCRLVSYSRFMAATGLSCPEMMDYANSRDAFADVDIRRGRAIICYNDLSADAAKSARYRWSIAHELGHMALGHHRHPGSRIQGGGIGGAAYSALEREADRFAALLLVPFAALSELPLRTPGELMRVCGISYSAAQNQLAAFRRWRESGAASPSLYDLQIRALFADAIANILKER